ncbi:MAG: flagellar hook-basal body complex protein FliE [Proteobacteria bacterium]|nr:flagellar hook-basal body complex protein FliE [Pseudomonadota bacterium]
MSRINGGFNANRTYQLVQEALAQKKADKAKAATRDFAMPKTQGSQSSSAVGSKVDSALQPIHNLHDSAGKMVIDMATGRDTNIHNTMVELNKGDIALKYAVNVRNRALQAYEEMMRIQV